MTIKQTMANVWLVSVCAVLLLVISEKSYAEHSVYDVATLYFNNVEQGQHDIDIVTAIVQDNEGFMWFGTQQGLFKYDGYTFTRYSHDINNDNSISGNYINRLLVDKHNQIWIGTYSRGMSVLDPETGHVTRLTVLTNSQTSIATEVIRDIVEIGDEIVFGTSTGLFVVNSHSKRVYNANIGEYCDNSSNTFRVVSMLRSRDNSLYLSYLRDRPFLCKLSINEATPSGASNTNKSHKLFSTGENIEFEQLMLPIKMFEAKDGKIWIGTTYYGFGYLDSLTNKYVSLTKENEGLASFVDVETSDIIETPYNEIWVATYGSGVVVFDATTAKLKQILRHDPIFNNSINQDEISVLYTDSSGIIWVGTWGSGLNSFNSHNQFVRIIPYGANKENTLSQPNILSILELNDNSLLAGGSKLGVEVIPVGHSNLDLANENKGTVYPSKGTILSMAKTHNDTTWISTTENGLLRRNKDSNTFEKIGDTVSLKGSYNVMKEIKPNELWLGSNAGVEVLNANTLEAVELSHFENFAILESSTIYGIEPLTPTSLLLGGDNGAFVLDLEKQRVTALDLLQSGKQGPTILDINGIAPSQDGSFILSTGSGIYLLFDVSEQSASLESINQGTGRPMELSANAIEDRQGRIWHSKGLVDRKKGLFREFSATEGWDAGTIWTGSSATLQNGDLAFGGSKGVLIVRPDVFKSWEYSPPLVITKLEVNNREPEVSGKLILPPNTESFSIEFAALDYSGPKLTEYQYKLVGFNDSWINTNSQGRRVSYTNLRPGNYTFELRSKNRAGVSNKNQINLSIEQVPAWYQTTWFKLLVVFASLCFLYLLFQVNVRRLRAQKKHLNKLVRLRTKEISSKNASLKLAMEKIERASLTDELTQTHNRRFFSTYIEKQITQLRSVKNKRLVNAKQFIGLILCDIDNFKQVNDVHGHHAGDQVLIEVSRRMKEIIRGEDQIVRWGGEEFLIICHTRSLKQLEGHANRLRRAIADNNIDIGDKDSLKLTCSFGACLFPFFSEDIDTKNLEKTINIADVALYISKTKGKNRTVSIRRSETCEPSDSDLVYDDPKAAISRDILNINVTT